MSREWFTATDMAKHINGNSRDIANYLREMARNGELDRKEYYVAGNRVVKWQGRSVRWLSVPWRSSIPPQVYGGPEWGLYDKRDS